MLRLFLLVLLLLGWALPASAESRLVRRQVDALLKAESFKVRLKAARAIGRAAAPAALQPLAIASEDPHPLVRAAVAHALRRYEAPRAVESLCRLKGDPDAFVRKTARAALDAKGGAVRCRARVVKVRFRVTGGDPALQAMVLQALQRHAAGNSALSVTDDPGAEGVELMVRLVGQHRHHARGTDIRCQTTQSVVSLPSRSLQAPSWTLNADMTVQGAPLADAAVPGEMKTCMGHLVPRVYDGLVAYLDRAR